MTQRHTTPIVLNTRFTYESSTLLQASQFAAITIRYALIIRGHGKIYAIVKEQKIVKN